MRHWHTAFLRSCRRLLVVVVLAAVAVAHAEIPTESEPATPGDKFIAQFTTAAGHAPRISSSKKYRLLTDAPTTITKQIASYMDELFDFYDQRFSGLAVESSDVPRLYIFQEQGAYDRFLKSVITGVMPSNGAFFRSGGESGLACWIEGRSRESVLGTLRHEAFHQFTAIRLALWLPPAIDEGMAEYYTDAIMGQGTILTGLRPEKRLAALRHQLEDKSYMPLNRLLAVRRHELERMGLAGSTAFYQQSWALVYFLLHGDGGRYAAGFERYLRRLSELSATRKNGSPGPGGPGREVGSQPESARPREVFAEAFEVADAGALEEAWRRYYSTAEPHPLSLALDELRVLAAGVNVLYEKRQIVRDAGSLYRLLDEYRLPHIDLFESAFTRERDLYLTLNPSADRTLPPELVAHYRQQLLRVWWSRTEGELEADVRAEKANVP